MKKLFEVSINYIPPSYNNSFKICFNTKQVYLSREAKQFKDTLALSVPFWDTDNKDLSDIKICVVTDIFNNWYYKNGKMKKQDIQNMDKLIVDAIFKRIGIDDSHVWSNTNNKIQSEEQKTLVTLYEM